MIPDMTTGIKDCIGQLDCSSWNRRWGSPCLHNQIRTEGSHTGDTDSRFGCSICCSQCCNQVSQCAGPSRSIPVKTQGHIHPKIIFVTVVISGRSQVTGIVHAILTADAIPACKCMSLAMNDHGGIRSSQGRPQQVCRVVGVDSRFTATYKGEEWSELRRELAVRHGALMRDTARLGESTEGDK